MVPPNTDPEIRLTFQNDQCFTNDIESGLKLSPGVLVPHRSLFDANVKEKLLLYHLHDVFRFSERVQMQSIFGLNEILRFVLAEVPQVETPDFASFFFRSP